MKKLILLVSLFVGCATAPGSGVNYLGTWIGGDAAYAPGEAQDTLIFYTKDSCHWASMGYANPDNDWVKPEWLNDTSVHLSRSMGNFTYDYFLQVTDSLNGYCICTVNNVVMKPYPIRFHR